MTTIFSGLVHYEDEERTDPRPCRLAANTGHLGDAACEYATKGSRQRRCREEESHPEAALVSLIPHRDVVVDFVLQLDLGGKRDLE